MADKKTACHSLGEVCARELQTITDRRRRVGGRLGCAKDKMAPAASTLIGLALSGGGIRSAATNLGVLQGLAKSGIMQLVDYLSTVSGGGYIGSCLSSLLSNVCPQGNKRPSGGDDAAYRFTDDSQALFTTAWESFPFRDDHVEAAAGFAGRTSPCGVVTGKEQMEHLRTRANYLAPRPTYLSNSVMRAVGSVTLTSLTPFLWFLLVIAVLTSLYMGVVAYVAPGLSISAGEQQPPPCAFVIDNDATVKAAPALMASLPEKAAKEKDNNKEILESDKAAWNKIKEYAKTPFVLLREMPWQVWGPTGLAGFVTAVALVSPWGLAIRRFSRRCGQAKGSGEDTESQRDRTHFRETFIFVLLALVAVVLYCICKVQVWEEERNCANGALLLLPSVFLAGAYLGSGFVFWVLSRITSKCWRREERVTMNMTMGVFFVLFLFTLVLAMLPGLILAADAVTVLFVEAPLLLALRWWLGRLRKENEKQTKKMIPAKFTNFLLGLVVPLLVLLAVVGTGSFLVEHWLQNWPAMDGSSWQALKVAFWGSVAVLLIFSALVDVNRVAPHYFYRDRLAEAFLRTLSPRREADELKRDDIKMRLCNLHGSDSDGGRCMGRGAYLLINATLNLTAAFDLKGFNRRSDIFTFSRHFVGAEQTGYVATSEYDEGLQLARAMTISGAAFTSVMGVSSSLASSFACTILGVRLGYWLKNPRGASWRGLAPFKLFRASFRLTNELLCNTHARGPEIYLSDGGHSGDNLGIIPLLRRRVKVVIASDSECDPKHAFDSFNSSVRQAYVDEGIKIRISLDDTRLDEKELSKKHYAVGRILYPDRPWQPSWLILLKNTITSGEIETILNYKQKSKDFPHETTGDQFFTEEQFESYRALGRNAAEEAFTGLDAVLGGLVGPETERGEEDCNPWFAAEELCRRLAGDQNRTHPWDDVLQAMRDAEQAGFQDWVCFKAMIKRYAVGLISIARPKEPFAEVRVEDWLETLQETSRLEAFLEKYAAKVGHEATCLSEQDFWQVYDFVSPLDESAMKLLQRPAPRSMGEFRSLRHDQAWGQNKIIIS